MKDGRTLLATSIFYYTQGGQFTGSILMTSELRRNSNKSFSKKQKKQNKIKNQVLL